MTQDEFFAKFGEDSLEVRYYGVQSTFTVEQLYQAIKDRLAKESEKVVTDFDRARADPCFSPKGMRPTGWWRWLW